MNSFSLRHALAGMAAALLAIGAASAPALHAQTPATTGTISGTVTESGSGRPLANVRISIEGTTLGTVSREDGQFTLPNVPAGTHRIQAAFIGFAPREVTVTVTAGGTADVNIELATRAIALDEVMVTAAPASAQQRRAIGAGISVVDVESRLATAPVTDLSQVLQGREAGVVNMSSGGTQGTAGLNVLRGISSIVQDNQPLIYVDGVRMDRGNTSLISTGGQTISRMVDIPPQDIARIELIKGSAATAMYGSEASSGVIQIFTKRGRPGETVYDATVRMGTNTLVSDLLLQHPDPQYPSANDFVSTGLHQEYTASVRGATESFSYFVSGSHTDSEGAFVNNYMRRTASRVNLSWKPSETLTGDVSTSFGYTDIRLPSNDNVTTGILTNVYLGNPITRGTEHDPYGSAFEPVAIELSRSRNDEAYRYSSGITLNHTPSSLFSHRLTLGLDFLSGQGTTMTPWYEEPNRPPRQGGRSIQRRNNLQTNIDYGLSLRKNFTESMESHTTLGFQFFTQRDHRSGASGDRFAAPPLQSLGGTEAATISEAEVQYTTGGIFGQQQFGFDNKLFLIVGGRADGSSAFGDDFGFQFFPKVSVSYVVSDESWFSLPYVSMLRLRGAWGKSGTQPGAFDKLRLWSTVHGMDGRMGLRPSAMGNPDLGPEISQEFEAGFDANLFNDRMSFEFSAYNQRTDDLHLQYEFPVSTGILASQIRNAGSLRNRGIELSSRITVAQGMDYDWSVNFGYAYNSSKVISLAGSPSLLLDRFGTKVVEGYPMAGKWEHVTVGYDANGFPIASDTAVYIGPSIPPHNGNFGTSLTWRGITASLSGQFALGLYVNNHIKPYMAHNKVGVDYFRELERTGGDPNSEAMRIFEAKHRIYGDFIERADWLKLREATISYALPYNVTQRMGARSAVLSLSGRNLLTVSKYSGIDPEVSSTFSSGNNLSVGADYFTVPPSRQVIVGLSLSF